MLYQQFSVESEKTLVYGPVKILTVGEFRVKHHGLRVGEIIPLWSLYPSRDLKHVSQTLHQNPRTGSCCADRESLI